MEPLQREAQTILGHSVGYAQMGLKTALLLNGGGLIAIPAFAELTGTIWARGFWPPMISMSSFLLGIICASIAIALSFFVFLNFDGAKGFEIARVTADTSRRYKALENDEPVPDANSERDEMEQKFENRAYRIQKWAIGFGIAPLVLFIIGSVSGAYILSCGEITHSDNGKIVCSGDRYLSELQGSHD